MQTTHTARFELSDIRFRQRRDPTRGSDTPPIEEVVSLKAQCAVCGNTWRAYVGDPSLSHTIGGIHLCCPLCDNDETISVRELAMPF